jgi:hypothetical protein
VTFLISALPITLRTVNTVPRDGTHGPDPTPDSNALAVGPIGDPCSPSSHLRHLGDRQDGQQPGPEHGLRCR